MKDISYKMLQHLSYLNRESCFMLDSWHRNKETLEHYVLLPGVWFQFVLSEWNDFLRGVFQTTLYIMYCYLKSWMSQLSFCQFNSWIISVLFSLGLLPPLPFLLPPTLFQPFFSSGIFCFSKQNLPFSIWMNLSPSLCHYMFQMLPCAVCFCGMDLLFWSSCTDPKDRPRCWNSLCQMWPAEEQIREDKT